MFAIEDRERVRERLIEFAEADPRVAAAAITGSYVAGGDDEWSDIDLAFAIRGELAFALQHWTAVLYRDFAALHHWDLPFASSVYRVFLVSGCLEVDIAFTPEADFGPRGPNWRTSLARQLSSRRARPAPRRSRWPRVAPRPPRPGVHRAREAVAGGVPDQRHP